MVTNIRFFKHFQGIAILLSTAFRTEFWTSVGAIGIYMFCRIESPVVSLGLRIVVDALESGLLYNAIIGMMAIVSGIGLFLVLDQIAWRCALALEERVGFTLEREVAETVSSIPGIEHLENPEYFDRVEILREQGWMLGRMLYVLPMHWGDLMRVIFTFVLLATVHPILLLLFVFALPSLFTTSVAETITRKAEEQVTGGLRKSRHLFELCIRADAAKELRIFGLRQWIFKRHGNVWHGIHHQLAKARLSAAIISILGWFCFAIGFCLALIWVVMRVLSGEASLGDLVLTLTLGSQVSTEVRTIASFVMWVKRTYRLSSHLLWLKNFASQQKKEQNLLTLDQLTDGIEFKNVTFRYPGTNHAILKNISFKVPVNSNVAIVGENGAGKTTLVKLLCRMYEPSEGTILVDGTPLSKLDHTDWLTHITAAFQDFCRFEFLIRETVGVGDLTNMQQQKIVERALEQAEAQDVVAKFSQGLDTQLGSNWDGGQELSGGQWQKLAIARAMMRDRPLLRIFDEPTANLDPQTEHDVFERYSELTRQTSKGTITLLISHRFSTVTMADIIIVLKKGEIVEIGSHMQLLEKGGLYAHLFGMQKKAFE
jgi:ATP-binding cassette subfamily B protein